MSAKSSKIPADLEYCINRLKSALEHAFDGHTANDDLQVKYLALMEKYEALSSLCQSAINTPPIIDKHNQLRLNLPPEPQETAHIGLVLIEDLLNTVTTIGTTNIFEVLRYHLANVQGDAIKMVEVRERLFYTPSTSPATSLTLSENLSKLDLIRIIRSFVDSGFLIDGSTGKSPTYKALYDIAEQVLNVDLSDAPTKFSTSIKEACTEETQTAVFGTMAQMFLNKSVRKKLK